MNASKENSFFYEFESLEGRGGDKARKGSNGNEMGPKPGVSTATASSSSSPSCTKCCSRGIECVARACILCTCCPLCIVWCCVKLPCKVGWYAARRLTGTCCRSDLKIVAASSSFSDIDFESEPSFVDIRYNKYVTPNPRRRRRRGGTLTPD
uniref:Uncharacterized protein n=1 Tax=Nelumbo nucifera TaxID=4432 RepID=A0A822YMN1_NELNU|nr:TPA_asm: hypothetical protein HUJ06_006074 [Nelumbo nucifera]